MVASAERIPTLTLSPPGPGLAPTRSLAPLGAGGMGEVYRARDTRLGREVAVKVLLAPTSPRPDTLRRFERRPRATGRLNHPNILAVYDFGEHEDAPFLRRASCSKARPCGTAARGPLPLAEARRLRASRSRRASLPRTARASSTATSSRTTCSSPATGASRSSTSAWRARLRRRPATTRRRPTRPRHTDRARCWAPWATWLPEQVRGQTADHRSDIFSLRRACSTRCFLGGAHS